MEGVTCSKIVAGNLSAMNDARQAFIKSESDEKLRRAFQHQFRTSSEVKYVTGDKRYYKRQIDDYWKGPATVIGQENQQVLIKHDSTYQRMHPCRLRLIDYLNLREEVNSYDSKEIQVSGNKEQQMSAEMDTDELEETSLKIEPDNGNAEQSDDTYDESFLDNNILRKLKIRWHLLERVETNGKVEQFILELANRRADIKIGLT